MKHKTILILTLLLVAILAACEQPPTPGTSTTPTTTQELKKFNSVNEIREFLKDTKTQTSYWNARTLTSVDMEFTVGEMADASPMAKAAASSNEAQDVSTTNVQVKGVDEADFVKNDNKYIYTLTQNNLIIVDAYPADSAKIISETEIEGKPRNMFVNNDRLVVFTEMNDETLVFSEFDFMPRERYTQATHALVYDISNRKKPKLVNDFNLNGNFFQARMIGNYIYFIVKDNLYYYDNFIDTPILRNAETTIIKPDIYYFDNPENNYVFHTIASFNINDQDIEAKTFMMGYSNTLYVSQDNIYITYQKNLPRTYYKTHNEERFYKVVVPLLPNSIRSEINEIKNNDNLNSYEKWDSISIIMEDMYNNMDKDDKEDLVEEIAEAIEEYEAKLEAERRKTVIHKININKGNINYDTRGEVMGYLLNQFSMDEHDNNLRVATTVSIWRRDREMYNNVYVLDEDLDVVGELEDIAPDERIYSTRFIGDRLYMVTFKNIDPFFVIDLSNPKKPTILGELKIPGFSDYLHPYDEDHIIGIGKETEGNQWGGVSTKGVKIALFDVSDVNNPTQVNKYEIGEAGTDSEALRDHKAFLFDKKRNLLVIPIRERTNSYMDPKYNYYRWKIWQGAYVLGVDAEKGIWKKGTITHEDSEDDKYYWRSPSAVRRSLYMDNILYTISAKKIKANNIEDIDEEIVDIDLPFEGNNYYWY